MLNVQLNNWYYIHTLSLYPLDGLCLVANFVTKISYFAILTSCPSSFTMVSITRTTR